MSIRYVTINPISSAQGCYRTLRLQCTVYIVPYVCATCMFVQITRHLKVVHEDSPYFKVVCQKPVENKVAPGMEAVYLIIFTPDENKVSFQYMYIDVYRCIIYAYLCIRPIHLYVHVKLKVRI